MIESKLPIVQAPMASSQGSALAIAVSNAGGLGSLPCAILSLDQMKSELTSVTRGTSQPYNVNFFCHTPPEPQPEREAEWKALLAPYYNEFEIDPTQIPSGPGRTPFGHDHADILESFKPPIVSFHFGLPSPELVARVKAMGSQVWSSATTLDEALWLEARGVDAIIAQGVEAGGHRGIFLSEDLTTQVGTFALVPQIAARVKVPVIAAGGIADARGVAAVMKLGASAAQLGTAYLLCPEATTSAVHRAAIKSDEARHTALTNLFTGRPARGIVNRFIQEMGPINPCAPAFPLAASAIAPIRQRAEAAHSGSFSPLWCGQNARGAAEISAAELTASLYDLG